MANPDQPYEQALLYLRAAGHDTGAETRARLKRLVGGGLTQQPALNTAQLLQKLPQWFDLPGPRRTCLLPPIDRASIGYPDA